MGVYNGTHAYGIISAYGPSSDDLADTLQDTNHLYRNVYTSGTGSYQCDSLYSNETTFSGLSAYDLTALTDRFGATLTLTKVKALAILNKQAATGETLTLSGDWFTSVFGAGATFVVGPGGAFILEDPIDGIAVTETTADGLSITTAGAYKHQIFIAGLD